MSSAARAYSPERRRLRSSLQPSDKFGRRLRRQGIFTKDPQRRGCQQRDRLKVLEYIVIEWVDRGGTDMARPVADADCVAVRVGVDDTACRNRTAGATDGFDNDGLAERVPHRIAENARQRIRRAARRKSDHHGNRA